MLFYFLLIIASPFLITAFQQKSDNAVVITGKDQIDGPVFDRVACKKFKEKRIIRAWNCDDSFDTCMRNCPMTLDINPVCGTDQVTYINESELKCAQSCGKDVTIKHRGEYKTDETD